MAFPASESDTKNAHDLVVMSDVELDRYLEEKCRSGGVTVVSVNDPENITASLIQRLKDRVRNASDTCKSRPVDLDQVNARLSQVHDNDTGRPLSPATDDDVTEPPTPDDVYERRSYQELVSDGGRPLYPIHLLDDVARDPGAYCDMLRPWQDYPDTDTPDWDIFTAQSSAWRHFRKWQAYNREPEIPRYILEDGHYNDFIKYFRPGSISYTVALNNLLAKYDFHQQHQFHNDPQQQDKLTTWIEYLGFTCSFHYRYSRLARSMKPAYDAAWTKLVDAKVMRSDETEQSIREPACAISDDMARLQAWNAVASAERALISARGSNDGKGTLNDNVREAQSKLHEAKESLARVERRNGLITGFIIGVRGYLNAMRESERCSFLLQWIKDEIPLIEAEMKESAVTNTSPEATQSPKKGRDQDTMEPQNQETENLQADACEPTCLPESESKLSCQIAGVKRTRADTTDDPYLASKRPKTMTETSPKPSCQVAGVKRTRADTTGDPPLVSKRPKSMTETSSINNDCVEK
ncbi:hypothetical protein F4802DRAFT_618835 [Xylaria palmicola]|nr:hypothetical protein F4802DRAFT_618835 [Xylaria palmicola]